MPTELTVLVLLITGLALMGLEAFVPSFGIIGFGGCAAFLIALWMMDHHLETFYGWTVDTPILIAIGVLGVIVMIASLVYVRKALKVGISAGAEIMPGMSARVVAWSGTSGRVRIEGEEWAATGRENLLPGD